MSYDWWIEQVQILHTEKANREASVKPIEVFVQEQKYLEGLKTVVAVRAHIHHRGDCCVCPGKGLVCVSRLQSWWMAASPDTQIRLDSSGTR